MQTLPIPGQSRRLIPAEKGERFISYFRSVFRPVRQTNNNKNVTFPRTDIQLSEIILCVEEVDKCLSDLDPAKASGSDGIPCRLFMECSAQIAPSLCALFNHSLLRNGHQQPPVCHRVASWVHWYFFYFFYQRPPGCDTRWQFDGALRGWREVVQEGHISWWLCEATRSIVTRQRLESRV